MPQLLIVDILTVGCYDKDIQGELLAHSLDRKTTDEKFELMHSLESSKRARNELLGESTVNAQKSSYHRTHKQPAKKQKDKFCHGCGSDSHGPKHRATT